MSAATFTSALLTVGGLLALLLVFVGVQRSPKAALLLWLLVICFVPVWIGRTVYAYFPAFVIVGLLVAVGLLPSLKRVRWTVVDILLGGVALLVVAEYALGLTTRTATFDLVLAWGGAFALARVLPAVLDPHWIYGAAAVFFGLVAVLAIGEFVASYNPFTTLLANSSATYATWGPLQVRGSVTRAEGAFGHSIALGSSLGIAAALTLGSRLRPVLKTGLLLTLALASVLTFSRTGMLTVGLSVVLGCVFLRDLSSRYRWGLLAGTAAAAAVAFASVRDVLLSSGTEATGSALYRSDLLQLVGYIQPLGLARNFNVSTTSEVSIGEFGSIDNAMLLFGLTYGWIPAVLVVVAFAAAVVVTLRRRATPPVIAVVAQLPAFVTVALITQYEAVAWFAIGLAVSTQVLANDARSGRKKDTPRPLPRNAGRPAPPALVPIES